MVGCEGRHVFRRAKNIHAGRRLGKSQMNLGFSLVSYGIRTLRVLAPPNSLSE